MPEMPSPACSAHRSRGSVNATRSAKKATVLITVNSTQELFQRVDLSLRPVAVPLQVCANPEHFPDALGADKSRLSHRSFKPNGIVLPVRPNLINLDALAINSAANVELLADVRRRAMKSAKAFSQCLRSSSVNAKVIPLDEAPV